MLLRHMIIGGMTFAMLGVTSFYAAPAKKMSTVRAGQLEAEYRKATPARKDQIIQELTAAGFDHIVQRIIKRDEIDNKQVDQKLTQASKKMSTVRAGQLETEYRKATPARKDQIIQELIAAGFDHIAQRIIKRYGPSKQPTKQASTKAEVVVQSINTPVSEKQVEQSEQRRIEQERQEIISMIETTIAHAQNAKKLNLKNVEAALAEITGEPLRIALRKLAKQDQDHYLQLLKQEEDLLETRKRDLEQYNQQLQGLEREIGYIVHSAKMASEVDAMRQKIEALADSQKKLHVDENDIKKLLEQLEQKKQLFLEEQKKERKEIEAKVNQVIAGVNEAESLDQINQALSELKGEKLRAVLSKLEEKEQNSYQDRLSQEEKRLEQKKQELLRKQTEKEKAEQIRKAKEEAEKKKAAQDAALKAEQEEEKQQALELTKKKNKLIQDIEKVIKDAEQAKTIQQIAESEGHIQVYLQGELATRALLTDVEKKELELRLRNAFKEIRKKRANLIAEEKIIAKIQAIKNKITEATTVSSIRPILDKIEVLEQEIERSGIEKARSAQLTQELDELKKRLQQEMQSIQQKNKEDDQKLANMHKVLGDIVTKAQNAKTEQEIVQAQQELEAFAALLTEKSKQIFKNVIDEQSRILLNKKKKIEELASSNEKKLIGDISVPRFDTTKGMLTYNNVSIIMDKNDKPIRVQYQGADIDLAGLDATKNLNLWIGSQIYVDSLINKAKADLVIAGVQAPADSLVIGNSVQSVINLTQKNFPLVKKQGTEQHDYFYNYIKPTVERKLKKLEGIVTQ